MTLLHKVAMGARAEGTAVMVRIGDIEVNMSYDDAFEYVQSVRIAAREAKRNAGDVSRRLSVIGHLTAAK